MYCVGYSFHYQNIHAKKSGKENKGRGCKKKERKKERKKNK
jgi:hypothetical protein